MKLNTAVSLGTPVTFVQINTESRKSPSSKIRNDKTLAPANFMSSLMIFPFDLNTVTRLRKYATRTLMIQQITLLMASLSEICCPKASTAISGTIRLKILNDARLTTVVSPPLTRYIKILRYFSCWGVRCSPPTTTVFKFIVSLPYSLFLILV